MSELKAVLFDYDGVIVKPNDNILAWKIACNKFGFSMINDDWYLNEGLKSEEISMLILKKYNIKNVAAEQLTEEKNEQYEILLKKNNYKVEVYKEVCSIFDVLKSKNIRIGLVTGSSFSRVKKSIPEIMEYFDIIVTADSLDINGNKIKGKKYPDPWVLVLKKINVPIEQSVVVENATLGIKSAKMAGLFCLALETTLKEDLLKNAGADLVFKNHKYLLNYFKHYCE